MTADEYVPSEAEMIAGLVQIPDEPAGLCRRVRPDEMKRGLARVRRDAKAEAWDACVDEAAACGWTTGYASRDVRDRNPYRETGDQR